MGPGLRYVVRINAFDNVKPNSQQPIYAYKTKSIPLTASTLAPSKRILKYYSLQRSETFAAVQSVSENEGKTFAIDFSLFVSSLPLSVVSLLIIISCHCLVVYRACSASETILQFTVKMLSHTISSSFRLIEKSV